MLPIVLVLLLVLVLGYVQLRLGRVGHRADLNRKKHGVAMRRARRPALLSDFHLSSDPCFPSSDSWLQTPQILQVSTLQAGEGSAFSAR